MHSSVSNLFDLQAAGYAYLVLINRISVSTNVTGEIK